MFYFKVQSLKFKVYFVDFCHDSANHASMLALAAPKVQSYLVNENFMLNPKSCVVVGYELLDSSGVFT